MSCISLHCCTNATNAITHQTQIHTPTTHPHNKRNITQQPQIQTANTNLNNKHKFAQQPQIHTATTNSHNKHKFTHQTHIQTKQEVAQEISLTTVFNILQDDASCPVDKVSAFRLPCWLSIPILNQNSRHHSIFSHHL